MNGILSVLKPPGMTSHDVVSQVRKITGIKKVGHTGTLDPGAAGVLPICIGKATKIVDFIMDDIKTYICELTLGNRTDTYDKYGSFIFEENKAYSSIEFLGFQKVINEFIGQISQRPPLYSAKKVDGVRAYELARRGEIIELPEKMVTIYEINVLKFSLPTIMMEIKCSKGTYIRSICNDIGEKLGCGGYMSFLIRTSTGNFNLSNSYVLDELNRDNLEAFIVPTDSALNMKSLYVDEVLSKKILNGNSICISDSSGYKEEERIKVYIKPNDFVGIGTVSKGILHMEKLLI